MPEITEFLYRMEIKGQPIMTHEHRILATIPLKDCKKDPIAYMFFRNATPAFSIKITLQKS